MLFKFSIGGYPGPFFHLETWNDQLVCRYVLTAEKQLETVIIPIEANVKWNDVIAFLSSRKWKEQYIEADIVDGTNWELHVKSATVDIRSSGSNAYPPGFRKFLRLLNEITAEKEVTIY